MIQFGTHPKLHRAKTAIERPTSFFDQSASRAPFSPSQSLLSLWRIHYSTNELYKHRQQQVNYQLRFGLQQSTVRFDSDILDIFITERPASTNNQISSPQEYQENLPSSVGYIWKRPNQR